MAHSTGVFETVFLLPQCSTGRVKVVGLDGRWQHWQTFVGSQNQQAQRPVAGPTKIEHSN
jgi:hypothetical protein